MEQIPGDVTKYYILEFVDMTPLELYESRLISKEIHKRYLDILRDWVSSPESWVTAIKNDDTFLFQDLLNLISRRRIMAEELNEYVDEMTNEVSYTRSYKRIRKLKDLRSIGLPLVDLFNLMYENEAHDVFDIAMTDQSFRDYIMDKSDSADEFEKVLDMSAGNPDLMCDLAIQFHDNDQYMGMILHTLINKNEEAIPHVLECLRSEDIYLGEQSLQYMEDETGYDLSEFYL